MFLKDSLKYGLGKRTSHRRKVDELTKRHILRATSNKTISCFNIIHNLNLKMSRWTINRASKKVKHLEKKYSPPSTKSRLDLRLKWLKDHMIWNEA